MPPRLTILALKPLLTLKSFNKKWMKEFYFNMKQEKSWVKTFHLTVSVISHSKSFNKTKKFNFLMIKINQIAVKMFLIPTLKSQKVILLLKEKNKFKSSENLCQLF